MAPIASIKPMTDAISIEDFLDVSALSFILCFYKTVYLAAILNHLLDYFGHAFVNHNFIVVRQRDHCIGRLLYVLNKVGVHRDRSLIDLCEQYHFCSRIKASLRYIVRMWQMPYILVLAWCRLTANSSTGTWR
jgi:hypothetical protein